MIELPDAPHPPAGAEEPFDFEPAEWLTLFPPALPPLDTFADAESDRHEWRSADPAAELRVARPLTIDSMLASFRGHGALHATAVAGLKLVAPIPLHLAFNIIYAAVALAIMGLAFRFNDGRFGGAQLATGFAAAVLFVLSLSAYYFVALSRLPSYVRAENPEVSLDASGLAPLARWLQLVARGREEQAPGSKPRSQLVLHKEGDELCPCPEASCAGRTPRNTAWHGLVVVASNAAFVWCYSVLIPITTFRTFGSQFFGYWWSYLLLTLLAVLLFSYLFMATSLISHPNTGVADVEKRLQHRAAALAVRSLLERYRALLLSGDSGPSAANAGKNDQYLYVRLHYRLCGLWRSRNSLNLKIVRSSYTYTVPVAVLVGMVVTMAAGSCICAWQLATIVFVLNWELESLVGLAALNEELATVASVYRGAQREIRVLVSDALAARPGGPGSAEAVDELVQHDRVLSSFLEMDDYRALFFGFPISYGLLRTFLVSAVTLGIGIWTVLRTLGVYVALESFCPGR
ncbi:hypothetical protein DFJ74DRAFT_703269 [Hyaloraphidium curvatum]|nr:hypothetical protein DFJ74DRAFT_703269 [Hyaloraphidium curvatum]